MGGAVECIKTPNRNSSWATNMFLSAVSWWEWLSQNGMGSVFTFKFYSAKNFLTKFSCLKACSKTLGEMYTKYTKGVSNVYHD